LESSSVYFVVFVSFLSFLVGSFLNVVIYRLPIMMENEWKCDCRELLEDELKNKKSSYEKSTKESSFNLVKPDSHCPSCNAPVKPWQNIPIISYVLLKGRCGHCKASISIRYPLIETLTALSSAMVAATFGYGPESLVLVPLTWGFIALIFIDIDKMLLPDQLTQPLLWLVLLASIWSVFLSPKDTIIGAITGYLCLWLVYWGFKLLTGKEGMGYGDFKLLAIIGAIVGWIKLPIVILMSSAVGAVIGGIMMVTSKANRNTAIPFGPYLAIAGWITILWGDGILQWYLETLK
jgi:leader peptidase (prepilin peptidase)/N-methyltransferase